MKKCAFILTLCALCALAACKRESASAENKPIVKINGTDYSLKDLWDFSNVTIWEMEAKDLYNEEVKDKLLADFVEHHMLLDEARNRGYTLNADRLDQFGLQLSTEQGASQLKALTGKYAIDAEKIAQLEEDRMLIDMLFTEVANSTPYITEDELKQYYLDTANPQAPVGEAHVLHIFTTDNESINQAAKELAGGIMFSEVARKYSQSPEASEGGDLNYIKETDFPELFSAAFRLKEGETSAVIKSDYGYHIFRMQKYAAAAQYEEAKDKLLEKLYTEKRQQTIREFIDALYDYADVQYLNNFTLSELIAAGE
jgi:parvulin-like peptidyl-prolyl isomerase